MKKYINLLNKIHLFKDMNIDLLSNQIDDSLYEIKTYEKGNLIYCEEDICTSCDIILQGNIIIQGIDENGSVFTISQFTKGDVIGENLLFSNINLYPMTIFAKTDSIILHMKKELILNLCQNDITFLTNFLSSVSNKTLILKDKVRNLSMKSLRECIVEFLVFESKVQNNNKIKLNKTKKELSEEFGVERTSLSRELNKMKQEGLIEYDSKSITILTQL